MYKDILKSLTVSPEKVLSIASAFKSALSDRPDVCGLKLLDSTCTRPAGEEQAEVLALDFGGTNLRLLLIRLKGDRTYGVLKEHIISLKHNRWGIDLTDASIDSEQLFDYIAYEIGTFTENNREYLLGYCFSFPFRQLGRNSAVLLEWTKEINTGGVVGQNVSNLLISALNKRGLDRIKPVAIINDTVGTLLAAAYRNGVADIGSICGTGHNSSFIGHIGHIINIESGNFFNEDLPLNQYDRIIDEESFNKQHQRFEKMVSGAYLGELFRLILLDLVKSRYLFSNSKYIIDSIANKNAIESRHICELLTGGVFKLGQEPDIFDLPDVNIMKGIAESLIIRSARLITSTYVGIIDYMDPHHQNNHVIAIDGSIYEKMPLFAQIMKNTLMEVFGDYQNSIAIEFFKDASGIGAAIAAVMAKDNQHKQL